jgi:hypothetical protein
MRTGVVEDGACVRACMEVAPSPHMIAKVGSSHRFAGLRPRQRTDNLVWLATCGLSAVSKVGLNPSAIQQRRRARLPSADPNQSCRFVDASHISPIEAAAAEIRYKYETSSLSVCRSGVIVRGVRSGAEVTSPSEVDWCWRTVVPKMRESLVELSCAERVQRRSESAGGPIGTGSPSSSWPIARSASRVSA